jgi:hypothetical protein
LLGGVLGLFGVLLRRALLETPAFAEMRDAAAPVPLREVLSAYPAAALVGIAVTALTAGFNGLLFVHMPGYLTRVLHYEPRLVSVAQNAGIAALSVGLLAFAWIGDRVPRRYLIAACAALLLAGSWPWYAAAAAGTVPLVPLLIIASLGASMATGVFAVVIADLFPTRVRYSGVALAYNVSFTAFSGTAPLIATALISATGSVTSPSVFMAGCAALALLGSIWIERHAGRIAPD